MIGRVLGRLFGGSTHDAIARLSALVLAGLLVVSVGAYAVIHYGLADSGPEYEAEFADAWPLVSGMDVRVSGAVAGSVRKVALTDKGTAEVTFQLRPGVPQPRADASVAIRQVDLLGDTDLELELGSASKQLSGPIPISRSIQEPRLDDFLNIFQKPVRAALQTFIVELGTALDNRGVDVNDAILKLRPGFEALGNVFTELQSQIQALRHVIGDAHTFTNELASRSADLDRLVSGLGQTVSGVAQQSSQLDSGLAQLPATLSETGTTLSQVQGLTDALHPLAQTIIAGAPGFQRAAGLLAPYSQALSTASKLSTPTIRLAGDVLRRAEPALQAINKTSFSQLLNPTSGLFSALKPLLGDLADGLFGNSAGGGLGGVVLPGNDVTAPNVDPARDYLSAYLVITCEMLGAKQGPGCLELNLQGYGSASGASAAPSGAAGPTAHRNANTTSALKPLLHYLISR